MDKSRKNLQVDWENLQRPGMSPDYLDARYERMDLAYERSDWIATLGGQAILRNNMPLLAYIGGKAAHFTGKDHNFLPGETVEKQLIIINNSPSNGQLRLPLVVGPPAGRRGHENRQRRDRPTGAHSAALRSARRDFRPASMPSARQSSSAAAKRKPTPLR